MTDSAPACVLYTAPRVASIAQNAHAFADACRAQPFAPSSARAAVVIVSRAALATMRCKPPEMSERAEMASGDGR
ncbi:MAG: hypothetical protein IPN98_16790 [Propionivibrio sp.]|nr:hypothetical protein [Propionivibrio sp.]